MDSDAKVIIYFDLNMHPGTYHHIEKNNKHQYSLHLQLVTPFSSNFLSVVCSRCQMLLCVVRQSFRIKYVLTVTDRTSVNLYYTLSFL